MAKLFPTQNPAEIDNDGERKMAEVLVEQLPDRVEIFHGFNWLERNNGGGPLQEGECDFLLLDPQRGMLFVEVKGGYLRFDGAGWVQNEVPTDKDPFAQAKKGMHAIEALVKKRFPRTGEAADLPFTRAFAVAFPGCRFAGALPPNIRRELILDAPRLNQLEDAVNRCFAAFRRRNKHRPLSERETQAIREALYPRYELMPVTWRKLEDQEARLVRLTADQKRLLDLITQHPRAAIRGVAGSGKTLLALAKAQETARDGRRTALLCYNNPLKEWLRRSAPESYGGDNLVIDTYHGLIDALCQVAGAALPAERDQDFWDNQAPEALMEACERLGPEHKFEAVIVDEGQDFHELWWTSLDAIFRNPAEKAGFYVFYDPRQNLYVADPSLPEELGEAFELTENCRNTVRIAAHCAGLAGYQNRHLDGAPEGDEPEAVQVETMAEAFAEAARRVREWCAPEQGGLALSQAAVLAPGFTKNEWPADLDGLPATQDFEQWERGEGVLIDSWHRFKGLEADAVVIIEVPMRNEAKEKINRYVAHSRAKHLLTLIEAAGQ